MSRIRTADDTSVEAGSHAELAPYVSIVMPMRNELRTLPAVIAALERVLGSDPACEAVICDNASTDGTLEFLSSAAGRLPRLTVITTHARTPSDVRNAGVTHARGSLLAFVDGDCEVASDYTRAVRAVFQDPRIGAAGSWVAMPSNAGLIERTWQVLHDDIRSGEVATLNGANLVVRREIFERIGGFDSSLRTNEDEELCHRIAAAGWSVRSDRRIRAIHHGNAKTLSEFYRRARWHAQSIPAMLLRGKIDKGIAALLVHLLLLGGALVLIWRAALVQDAGRLMVALGLAMLVPTASVAYRARDRLTASVNWPTALLMYWVFFLARAHGTLAGLVSSGAVSWKRNGRATE